MPPASLKSLGRALLSPPTRRRVRRAIADAPHRVRDFGPDILDRFASRRPLPPARLRGRVGLNSSRADFLTVGAAVSRDLMAALPSAGARLDDYRVWLDFGCGAGRVARHLDENPAVEKLMGVDVDREAVRWCQQHLRGRYEAIAPVPPTGFAAAAFDLIYSVSVFTHLDEKSQSGWLAEIHRLLRPGGLFLASTHSPSLTWSRPDLVPEQHARLSESGFLFAPAAGNFNEDSAFHSESYLQRQWGRLFEMRFFRTHGLCGYQDLSVWRKGSS